MNAMRVLRCSMFLIFLGLNLGANAQESQKKQDETKKVQEQTAKKPANPAEKRTSQGKIVTIENREVIVDQEGNQSLINPKELEKVEKKDQPK